MGETDQQGELDVRSIIGDVSSVRLMEDVRRIGVEDRTPGGEGEARVFDYIEQQLVGLSATIRKHSMEGFVSVPVRASLRVHTPSGDELVPCITHSGIGSTPPDGLYAPLVWAGKGLADDFADGRATGKIAVVSGRPTATSLRRAQAGGCATQIYIETTPVPHHYLGGFAGNPTDESLGDLSTSAAVSVGHAEGERLRGLIDAGPVEATVLTEIATGWRPLLLLTADIKPDAGESTFAFFGSHVDSWYQGAVDNGAGVAALMEIARVVAGRRQHLKRGVRLLFWSGHEQGLYAGSSWYVDKHWHELYENAIAALAIDSPGAANPTHLARSKVMDEVADVAENAAALVTGWEVPRPKRPVSGEQPLWRIGVPSLHPDRLTPADRSWMHTTADQNDLIDPQVLAMDTRIHLAALWAVVGSERLPLRYDTLANHLGDELEKLTKEFDLTCAIELARRLQAVAGELASLPARSANEAARRLGRALIPTLYTRSGRFDVDTLALKDDLSTDPKGFLIGLQDARQLAALEKGTARWHGLQVRLSRQRNRLEFALRCAIDACEEALRKG